MNAQMCDDGPYSKTGPGSVGSATGALDHNHLGKEAGMTRSQRNHPKYVLYSPQVREETGLCSSRGPRIGDEGVPYCREPIGHDGHHQPSPEDGWDQVTWGDL